MPKKQVLRRFRVRHARNSKFNNMGYLIDYNRVRHGELNEEETRFYRETVADDLRNWKNNGYGQIQVVQCAGWDIGQIRSNLTIWNNNWSKLNGSKVDAIYIDYLQLLKSSKRLKDGKVDLDEGLRECKQLAMSFGSGEQLLVVSAHQVTREGRKGFKDRKQKKVSDMASDFVEEQYFLWNLSSTAEAERSCDVSIWLLRLPEYINKHEIKIGIMKNRDGELTKPQMYLEDYATCYISNLQVDLSITESLSPEIME